MPITIIRDDEHLSTEFDGSIFYYKRIKDQDFMNIRRKHTSRGEVDHAAVGIEVLENYVVGWENVKDPDGNDVAFDRDLIKSLPSVVQVHLLNQINGDTSGLNALKKSKATRRP